MTLSPSKQVSMFTSILKRSQNSYCADCKTRNPRWASTTFGTLVCIRCSGNLAIIVGFHRKLGTHITKVKSVDLDSWTKEQIELYKAIGKFIYDSR